MGGKEGHIVSARVLYHLLCARPSFTEHNSRKKVELFPFFWHPQVKGLRATNLVSDL